MDIDILGMDLVKRLFQLYRSDRLGYVQYGSKAMRADRGTKLLRLCISGD